MRDRTRVNSKLVERNTSPGRGLFRVAGGGHFGNEVILYNIRSLQSHLTHLGALQELSQASCRRLSKIRSHTHEAAATILYVHPTNNNHLHCAKSTLCSHSEASCSHSDYYVPAGNSLHLRCMFPVTRVELPTQQPFECAAASVFIHAMVAAPLFLPLFRSFMYCTRACLFPDAVRVTILCISHCLQQTDHHLSEGAGCHSAHEIRTGVDRCRSDAPKLRVHEGCGLLLLRFADGSAPRQLALHTERQPNRELCQEGSQGKGNLCLYRTSRPEHTTPPQLCRCSATALGDWGIMSPKTGCFFFSIARRNEDFSATVVTERSQKVCGLTAALVTPGGKGHEHRRGSARQVACRAVDESRKG